MPTTIVTSHGAPIAYGGHHPGQLIVEHHAPAGSSPFVIVRAIDRCGEVEIRLEPAELDELVAQITAARDQPLRCVGEGCGWTGALRPTETLCPSCGGEVES